MGRRGQPLTTTTANQPSAASSTHVRGAEGVGSHYIRCACMRILTVGNVRLHTVERWGGGQYVVLLLGYVEGEDLGRILQLRQRLDEDQAALVAVQVRKQEIR